MRVHNALKMSWCAIAGLLFVCSCSDDNTTLPPDGAVFSENFIQVYIEPETLDLFAAPSLKGYIQMTFEGNRITNSDDDQKAKYEKYSSRYGDTGYNGKLIPYTNIVLSESVTAITVTCDKDISSEYPAGSQLNGLIKICATSPGRFIESGYTADAAQLPGEFENLTLNKSHGNYPVFKSLSELTGDDLTLLNHVCYLYIPVDLAKGEYDFTIGVAIAPDVDVTKTVRYIAD